MQSAFFLPVFLPTLLAVLAWMGSCVWLWHYYTHRMTAWERELVWAGLHGWPLFPLWGVSVGISLAAFSVSWGLLFAFEGKEPQGEWASSAVWPLPLVIAAQIAFNLLVVRRRVWAVCAALWVAVGGTVWLAVTCWKLFPDLAWVHALNSLWVLHGACWDAGFWFFTWRQRLPCSAEDVLFTIDDT
jgi:hypothetical protein